MSTGQTMLYVFESITALSAIAIFFSRNIFYAALLLIVCLLGVAGIFAVIHAEFLAVTQILIYAGGILLLIVFGIMLTEHHGAVALGARRQHFMAGLLAGISLLGMLWFYTGMLDVPVAVRLTQHSISEIGQELMSAYAAPFELGGILLLVSMIGAMITATFNRRI